MKITMPPKRRPFAPSLSEFPLERGESITLPYDPSAIERVVTAITRFRMYNVPIEAVICGRRAYFSISAILSYRVVSKSDDDLDRTYLEILSGSAHGGIKVSGCPVLLDPMLDDDAVHAVGNAEALTMQGKT